MLKVIMSKVIINLNMFGPFIKDEIVCNLNNTLIVTIYKSGTKKKIHISK